MIVPRLDEIVVWKSSLTMVRSENWSPLPRRSKRSDPSWKPETVSPKKLPSALQRPVPRVDEEVLRIVQVEPELVASGFELVVGRAAEEPIGPAAAVQRRADRACVQVVVAGVALQAVVEVAERRVAAEQEVVAVAARGDAAAIAGRERQLVVALLAEEVVEAARASVEEVVAGAAMDLVVAAEGGDSSLPPAAKIRSASSVPVITSSPLVPAMMKSVLSKSSGVKSWSPRNSTVKSSASSRPSSLVSATRKVLSPRWM